MKNRYQKYIHIFITTLTIFGTSCGNPQSNNQPITDDSEPDSLRFIKTNIEYLLPSPEEVIEIIFQNNIPYKPELILKNHTYNKVINSNYQALTLGMYIADFSYAILYNDINTCSKNLLIIQKLSDKIGIGETFKNQYYKRVQNNLSNMDSIHSIYTDISENSFSKLASTGNAEWLSLIAMGASIETIYIGYNALKTVSVDTTLKPFFIEQRMVFENFYQNYMVYNKHKKDLEKFNIDIEAFYSLFKLNIWLIVDKNKISKTKNDSILNVNYIVKTNQEYIDNLGKGICTLRNNLVELHY